MVRGVYCSGLVDSWRTYAYELIVVGRLKLDLEKLAFGVESKCGGGDDGDDAV